jgi:hypothetical protein
LLAPLSLKRIENIIIKDLGRLVIDFKVLNEYCFGGIEVNNDTVNVRNVTPHKTDGNE